MWKKKRQISHNAQMPFINGDTSHVNENMGPKPNQSFFSKIIKRRKKRKHFFFWWITHSIQSYYHHLANCRRTRWTPFMINVREKQFLSFSLGQIQFYFASYLLYRSTLIDYLHWRRISSRHIIMWIWVRRPYHFSY